MSRRCPPDAPSKLKKNFEDINGRTEKISGHPQQGEARSHNGKWRHCETRHFTLFIKGNPSGAFAVRDVIQQVYSDPRGTVDYFQPIIANRVACILFRLP